MSTSKRPTKSKKSRRVLSQRSTATNTATPQASIIHEGSIYYYRPIRTSEVMGTYNQDPENIITEGSRTALVNKSRYFVENVPPVKGAIEEISTYSIGSAWIPSFQGSDQSWGDRAEAWLLNWMNISSPYGMDLRTDLWLASIAVDRDGDVLMHLTFAQDGKYPKINFIPTHRVVTTQPEIVGGPFNGKKVFDGVILGENKIPIGYNIKLSDNINGPLSADPDPNDKAIQLPIESCHLIYEPRYLMQLRGFPSLATSITAWTDFRDIIDAEREAIKQAAAISLIEKNQIGGVLPGQYQFGMSSSLASWQTPNQPIYWKYYNNGMVRYFGSNDVNSGIEQMQNNRPGDLTQGFVKDYILRGAFNSLGIPLEICHDMSGMNSANTRAVLAKLQRKLVQRQTTISKCWRKAILYGISSAMKIGLLEYNKEWYKFTPTLPPSPSIDLGRDAKTDIEYYKIGANTLSDIYGSDGKEWDDKLRQYCKEKARLNVLAKEYGLDPRDLQILTPNQQPTEEAQDENKK